MTLKDFMISGRSPIMKGSWLTDNPPGERFRQAQDDHVVQTAVLLYPSCPREIEGWLNYDGHARDASCAKYGEYNNQPFTIAPDAKRKYVVQFTPAPHSA